MSTKALEKVVRDMACDYSPCLKGLCRKHDALAELEAIRKMARDWVEVDGQPGPGRMKRLDELLRAIAKEAL